MLDSYLYVLDIIGTIAFALSGAMVGINKKMDIFGVNILAITTAVGGGIVRDIIIGNIPPTTFLYPEFAAIASISATFLFVLFFFHKDKFFHTHIYERLAFIFDTAGLAAFTVDGTIIGLNIDTTHKIFLSIFLGMLTGVGGGILRDLFSNKTPDVFVKKIYASATIIGALITALLWEHINNSFSIITGLATVVLIRTLAAHFHWNLPRIT